MSSDEGIQWLDISSHRSRQVSAELVRQADLVLTMTKNACDWLRSPNGENADKIWPFAEFVGKSGDVSDPYGGDEQTYRECAEQLADLIQVLSEPLAAYHQ